MKKKKKQEEKEQKPKKKKTGVKEQRGRRRSYPLSLSRTLSSPPSLCRTSPNSSESPGPPSGSVWSPELQQRSYQSSDPVQTCDFTDPPAVKPTLVPTRKLFAPVFSLQGPNGGRSRTPNQVRQVLTVRRLSGRARAPGPGVPWLIKPLISYLFGTRAARQSGA